MMPSKMSKNAVTTDVSVESAAKRRSEGDVGAESPSPLKNQRGATALETVLLLGVIGVPSWFLLMLLLNILTGHYRMMTTINSLPFP